MFAFHPPAPPPPSTYLQSDESTGDGGGSGPHKGRGTRPSTDGQETEVSVKPQLRLPLFLYVPELFCMICRIRL